MRVFPLTNPLWLLALAIVVVWAECILLFLVWDGVERFARSQKGSSMLTLIKNIGKKLIYDELAVRRWLRSVFLLVGTGGVAFADQLAALIESPASIRKVKIVGVVCAALGGAITAGERNARVADPEPPPSPPPA